MDTITRIKITRCSTTEGSRTLAVVHLNSIDFWEKGLPVMVPYFKSNGKIDTIVAIGLKESNGVGTGPEYYSIISEGGKLYVGGVYEELPDVSSLVHNIPYVAKVDGEWKLVYIDDSGTTRIIGDIDPNEVIINLEDGHRYFYKDDEVIRDDSLTDLLSDDLEALSMGELKLTVAPQQEVFDKGASGSITPKFTVTVKSGKTDITSQCDLVLSTPGSGNIGYTTGNTLSARNGITSTTEYTITARYTVGDITLEASTESTIYVVDPVQHNGIGDPITWPGNGPLVLYFDLDDDVSIVRVPIDFPPFDHIYDENGLDYIDDYYPTYPDGNYRVYEKIDAVTIHNFKQVFTYGSSSD